MTVGELRRLLNTVSLDADRWPIGGCDLDQGDAFEIEGITNDPDHDHVWLNLRFRDVS